MFRYIITSAHYVWRVSSEVRLVSFFDLMSSGLLLVMRSAYHLIPYLSSFYIIVHNWSRSDVGSTHFFLNEPTSSRAESTKVKIDQTFDKLVILVFK